MTVAGNVGHGGLSGAPSGLTPGNLTSDFRWVHDNGAPPIDLFPKLARFARRIDVAAIDFNGTPRNGVADAGAYKSAPGGNPGWTLAAGFKGSTGSPQPNAPSNLTVN